jgi:hypothetical protein
MHSVVSSRPVRLAVAALGALALGLAAFHHAAGAAPRYWKQGYVHYLESDGYLYSFDAAWRVESLRTAGNSRFPAGVRTKEEPEREARMRRSLLGSLGVRSLDLVPVEGEREMDAIRALGYL